MGRAGTPVRGLRLPHQRSLTRSAARGDSPRLPRGEVRSDSLAERLATEAGLGLTGAPHERLSDREFEVLCALGSGIAVKDAAARLGLSPKTVSTYRARIFEKMNFSTGDLVRYVAQQGLIQ